MDLRSDQSGFSARVESKLFDKSERKEDDDIELLPINNRTQVQQTRTVTVTGEY